MEAKRISIHNFKNELATLDIDGWTLLCKIEGYSNDNMRLLVQNHVCLVLNVNEKIYGDVAFNMMRRSIKTQMEWERVNPTHYLWIDYQKTLTAINYLEAIWENYVEYWKDHE